MEKEYKQVIDLSGIATHAKIKDVITIDLNFCKIVFEYSFYEQNQTDPIKKGWIDIKGVVKSKDQSMFDIFNKTTLELEIFTSEGEQYLSDIIITSLDYDRFKSSDISIESAINGVLTINKIAPPMAGLQ